MNPKSKILTMILASIIILFACQVPAIGQERSDKSLDQAIKTLIENRLRVHGLLQGNNIFVSVIDGNVTLNGQVRSPREKRLAELDSYGVGKFHTVQNNLMVKEVERSDTETAIEVASLIQRHAFYTIFDWVEVQSRDRIVTLTGSVDAAWKRSEFVKQAEKTAGVKQIKNNIEVQPGSNSDVQLRIAAATSIYDDPLFEHYAYDSVQPIHIIVREGRVLLKGTVHSIAEKEAVDGILLTKTNVLELASDLMVKRNK